MDSEINICKDLLSPLYFMIRFFNLSFLLSGLLYSQIVLAQKKAEPDPKTNQKTLGIARIQIFASPAKGTSVVDVANMPLFFGAKSDELRYKNKKFLDQLPPSTGDSIRDLTSDSLAVFMKQDITTMSGYGDKGGNSKGKRNMIHDLPTENPQKMAVDGIFDEAIDIGCFWTFVATPNKDKFIPTVMLKLEIYDKTGQAKSEKSITLSAADVSTKHFKKKYGVEYDFVKGIDKKDLEDGGIAGNVIADVYLQALTRLFKNIE